MWGVGGKRRKRRWVGKEAKSKRGGEKSSRRVGRDKRVQCGNANRVVGLALE